MRGVASWWFVLWKLVERFQRPHQSEQPPQTCCFWFKWTHIFGNVKKFKNYSYSHVRSKCLDNEKDLDFLCLL